MIVRDVSEKDFIQILKLNEHEVKVTSPLAMRDLKILHQMAIYHKVVEINGSVAGFLLVFDQNKEYQSENYTWFNNRYDQFLYIDRIVVDKTYSGLKIGSNLYKDLFSFAMTKGFPVITCEYNIIPMNAASQAFHHKFGFFEVGQQWLNNGEKCVSLQVAKV